jgi:hypothetical protein
MVRLLQVLFLLIALALPAAAKPQPFIDITLETQEAFLGDSVVIEVRWSGLADPIDFSPLQRAATVMRETAGTRIAVIQGAVVEISSTRIELVPKAVGLLELGPLRAGDVVSNSVALRITEAKRLDWSPGPEDVRLEQTVSQRDPWLQQQVVLDIVLRTRHPIHDEEVVLPGLDGLRSIVVHKERRTLEEADGGWSQIAWRYLVFPQHSGRIPIAGARISGAIEKSRAERARFDLAAPPTDLTVRPAAFPATQWWIAARRLALSDAWSRDPRELKAGDEAERTITVSTLDALPEQIPDVAMDETRGLSITPLGVERGMKLVGDHVEAQASYRFRIRALSPVPVFLDTVRLRWWSTADESAEEAIIPARRIDIGIPDRQSLVWHALADAPWWWRIADRLGPTGDVVWVIAAAVASLLVVAGFLAWRRRAGFVGRLVLWRQLRGMRALARQGDMAGLYALLRGIAAEPADRRSLVPLLVALETALFGQASETLDLDALVLRAGHALRGRQQRAVSSLPSL